MQCSSFFFQAEDGIRDVAVTGVQTCALPICPGGLGDLDIWVSQRASVNDPWGPPQPLGPNVNSNAADLAPGLSPDGHRMYFGSLRAGGCGGSDLYVSHRHDAKDDFGWEPAVNLGCVVNTPSDELFPTFFEDDVTGMTTLYYASNRPGGLGGRESSSP